LAAWDDVIDSDSVGAWPMELSARLKLLNPFPHATEAEHPSMITLGLVFALLIGVPQDSRSTESQANMQQRAQDEYERHKQAAIRINELAGRIQSESDASTLVSEIAGLFAKELPPAWAGGGIRQRVAHAEYDAARSPATLITEQRITEVWNQYVREIRAPDEAIVSVAEIHNMRDAECAASRLMWERGNKTIWTMPNMFALGPDGRVADGCRALDAIRVIYDLEALFQNLRGARDRLQKGIVASEEIKKREVEPNPQALGTVRLALHAATNPIRPAEQLYVQEHGSVAYAQLLARLFDALFPPE
jgi:hypothetical protein